MSDILPNKNITPPQQSNYGLGASTNANWDKPKKPSDEERAKSLAMQKKNARDIDNQKLVLKF